VTTPIHTEVEVQILQRFEVSPFHIGADVRIGTDQFLEVSLLLDGPSLWLHIPTATYELQELHKLPSATGVDAPAGGTAITSAIPGRVAAILCKEGDTITAGTPLMVLDSMKMEHPIRAPSDGVVVKLPVSVGSVVQAGATLAVLKG
jgi:biotin carboxyl carrier protein